MTKNAYIGCVESDVIYIPSGCTVLCGTDAGCVMTVVKKKCAISPTVFTRPLIYGYTPPTVDALLSKGTPVKVISGSMYARSLTDLTSIVTHFNPPHPWSCIIRGAEYSCVDVSTVNTRQWERFQSKTMDVIKLAERSTLSLCPSQGEYFKIIMMDGGQHMKLSS